MVILEVLSGKPPFSGDGGLIVMRKVIEGERPGRPEGKEGVWFTDDLWEILEQCWLPQPGRRPTIEAIIRCLKQGSTAWQPLPPDSDDGPQSYSDDRSRLTWSQDPSIDPSMFLDLVLNLTHPQTAFAVDQIDPQDGDRTPAPSENQPRSVYAGQDSHRPAELPVSTMFDTVHRYFCFI